MVRSHCWASASSPDGPAEPLVVVAVAFSRGGVNRSKRMGLTNAEILIASSSSQMLSAITDNAHFSFLESLSGLMLILQLDKERRSLPLRSGYVYTRNLLRLSRSNAVASVQPIQQLNYRQCTRSGLPQGTHHIGGI